MKTIYFFSISATAILIMLAGKTESTAAKGLKWRNHYDSAKRAAQAAERPLLVVIENPTNQTEKIDESRLTESDRQALAKAKFELVRVDVNTDYGKKVAAAFGATKFPYTAVTDQQSVQIVFRKAGPMSEKDWTVALTKSKQSSKRATSGRGGFLNMQDLHTATMPKSTSCGST